MYAIESNKTQNLFPASSFRNFVLGIELKFKPQFKLLIFSLQWFRAIYIYFANNAKGIKTKLNHDIDNHKHLLVLYGQDSFGDAIASSIGYQQVACSRLRDGGGKSFSNKKCEKRAGAGERQGSHFSRRHRPLSQVVRVLFSLCSF